MNDKKHSKSNLYLGIAIIFTLLAAFGVSGKKNARSITAEFHMASSSSWVKTVEKK